MAGFTKRRLQGTGVTNQTSQILIAGELEPALSVQHLLAVSEHKRSGLIICKAHHAEFAGPGAVVGTLVEQACVSVIAIGAPEIVPVVTHQQRQSAYSRRIQWIRWLHKITEHPDPIQRTEKLFASFEEFFGAEALMNLPDQVLALLIGVLPMTIATVRSHYRFPECPDVSALAASYEPFTFNTVRLSARSPYPVNSYLCGKTFACSFEALYNLPSRD